MGGTRRFEKEESVCPFIDILSRRALVKMDVAEERLLIYTRPWTLLRNVPDRQADGEADVPHPLTLAL